MTATFIRVNASLLNGRIDAMYYRPEFVENAQRVRRSQLTIRTLKELTQAGRRAVYFSTSTLERGAAPANWVPFLTADDLGADGFHIDFNARRWVAPEFADQYPNGELRSNELPVKVKVPNQITAYCECAPDRRVLVSGTIWGAIVRRDRIDPHYLVAALSCEHAVLARTRLRTNLNVEFLSPADLVSLELPVAQKKEAQCYIGDKVRQAERLRLRARHIDEEATSVLGSALRDHPMNWVASISLPEVLPSGCFRTRVSSNLVRGRLNPAGYHPELRAIGERARKSVEVFRRLLDVAEIVTDKRPRMNTKKLVGSYISVLHVEDGGFVDMPAAATHKPDSDGRVCQSGDILLSGINPAANRVGVCDGSSETTVCSPEFSILVARNGIDPHYLAFALRSAPCLRQLVHLGQGTSSSRRRVEETELENVWVPVTKEQESIGELLAERQACVSYSGTGLLQT